MFITTNKDYTMKKYCFIVIFTSFTLAINAQKTQFSVVGGIANAAVQADFLSQAFNTGNGYYVGLGAEFSLLKRSSIYSELTYSNINGTDYFQLPVLYKYRFADKISILIGPQIGYVSEENTRDLTSFSIGLGAGLWYDFSDYFYALVRYTRQLNNHYTGPINDLNYKIDIGSVGIGFKF